MGMSAGGSGHGPRCEINVTPLVDVVLVMLIIFLLTTPIMIRHITIEVPRKLADDEAPPLTASKQISVLVKADGSVLLIQGQEETTVQRSELAQKLKPMIARRVTEKVVFIDFEDDVPYGDCVSAMDTVKGVGAEKVALKVRDAHEGQPPLGP